MSNKEFLPRNVSKPIAAGRSSGSIALPDRGLTALPRAVLDQSIQLDECCTAWCAGQVACFGRPACQALIAHTFGRSCSVLIWACARA